MALVGFVIPVRHPRNALDWASLKQRLAQTICSVSAQTRADWTGIVVANEGADLPEMPEKWRVERVTFQPNPTYSISEFGKPVAREAVRLDKGRRILAGMLAIPDATYLMVVDDDDFIHRGLVEYVASSSDEIGWRFDQGFHWTEGSRLIVADRDFASTCGTSHIMRRDLLNLPTTQDADPEYIGNMLGSHKWLDAELANTGRPLSALPFPGAIYRIGHGGTHTQSEGFVRKHLLQPRQLRRPITWFQNAARVRLLTKAVRRDFTMPRAL